MPICQTRITWNNHENDTGVFFRCLNSSCQYFLLIVAVVSRSLPLNNCFNYIPQPKTSAAGPSFSSPAFSTPVFLVLHFPVLHFSPLYNWSFIFQPCIFHHPCVFGPYFIFYSCIFSRPAPHLAKRTNYLIGVCE